MSTAAKTFKAVKTTNYKSLGGKMEVIDEIPVGELIGKLSKVLRNSNGTPYVWLNDGSVEGSSMVYMSTKGRELAEAQQDQLSRSKHAIQVWSKEVNLADGKKGTEEIYVIALTGETIEPADVTFVD